MRKERLLRQSQRITWCLQVLAGLCLVLLLAGQYVVLSSGGQKWTLVGQLEGEPLMELDPQTLLAGSAQERVYDVQLRAETMEKRAEAYAKYGQAAITEMVIDKLPEIARAIAEPMSKIGNITIIGGGTEDGGSATDVARMTMGTLKAITEGMKDTLGFDPVEVMRANTFEGKTSKDINLNVTGLPESTAGALKALAEEKE